ncbi:MAG: hypothetical protein MMC33_002267 [Icmadophila ericetorum]|nr:hypothetical protein [Icmadophila ericetorum]
MTFELLMLVATHLTASASHGLTHLEASELALGCARFIMLLIMSMVLVPAHCGRLRKGQGERQTLLDEGEPVSKYDSFPGIQEKVGDAQSTGWLDYFIGFSALFPYIWPSGSANQQAITIFCFILLLCQRVINVLVPYQLGVLVDTLGRGSMPVKEIALYCLYKGLQGQQGVIGSIRAILWIPISQSLYRRLSCAAFEHVLSLSLDFHLSKKIGEVVSALGKGGALNTFLDGFAFQLFPMVFDLGIAAVFLFISFDAFYSIIVIGVLWSYIFVTIQMAKYRGRVRREMAKRDREMDAAKTDAIMAYETVHHNCAVALEVSKFGHLVRFFQKAEFSVLFSLNTLNVIQNLIFTLGIVLVCAISAYQISAGLLKVSDFVTLITYFAQLQAPLAFFGSFYNQVQNNLVDAERMLDLFKKQPDVVDGPDVVPMPECAGCVSFKKVGFTYDSRHTTLTDISFTVEPGTSTAIVGESGSGKSTILKLLFRFYDVTSGSISVDDMDIRSVTVKSLRDHIGVVPQDTILFNDSIMYNIQYAKPNATDVEVFDACRAASIHHKILGFPEGYETAVGERGLKLSGGEKQRVAIARAILKQPQIMLLDEATASLDSHTEKQIQEALEDVTRGRTTITIAHRLSTITRADQILVLHDGQIIERGRHNELLALGGKYTAMWKKQTTAEAEQHSNGSY